MNKLSYLLALICLSCSSQTPIYTLGDNQFNKPIGSYIKDTENILSKFSGIWKFSNGGQNFIVSLQKAEQVDIGNLYKDMIFGSYILSENGTEIVNTTAYIGKQSAIRGGKVWNDQNKINLFFKDPERPKTSYEVTLIYSNTNGVEKLSWQLYITGVSYVMEGEDLPIQDYRVPQECELIKQ